MFEFPGIQTFGLSFSRRPREAMAPGWLPTSGAGDPEPCCVQHRSHQHPTWVRASVEVVPGEHTPFSFQKHIAQGQGENRQSPPILGLTHTSKGIYQFVLSSSSANTAQGAPGVCAGWGWWGAASGFALSKPGIYRFSQDLGSPPWHRRLVGAVYVEMTGK